MSRAERTDDQHDRFQSWLQGDTTGDPPRDAAVHAAHCVRCRAAMAGLDDLLLIDPARAPLPPSRATEIGRARPVVPPRLAAAAAATFVVVAATAWIGVGALAPGLIGGNASPTPDQNVLGGTGAAATGAPTLSASFGGVTTDGGRPSPRPTRRPSPTSAPPAVSIVPAVVTPVPTIARSPDETRRPSRSAAPSPRSEEPSVSSSASMSIDPTPYGPCDDGIDNDGDTLVDLLDPGCLSPYENEFAANP